MIHESESLKRIAGLFLVALLPALALGQGTTAVVLRQDFDGSALPPGVTETFGNIWHVSTACLPASGCSTGAHLYYGYDEFTP